MRLVAETLLQARKDVIEEDVNVLSDTHRLREVGQRGTPAQDLDVVVVQLLVGHAALELSPCLVRLNGAGQDVP